jgi:carbon monoxide dehydrogenase subunit G
MELQFNINKSAQFVFEHLRDMQKFVSVHPIIYKAEALGENRYKIYEKLKLLLVPMNFTYIVQLEEDRENLRVSYSTTVKKVVHINMNFEISGNSQNCMVKEVVNFNSFLPVKPIMKSIFRKQHHLLFLNIDKASMS